MSPSKLENWIRRFNIHTSDYSDRVQKVLQIVSFIFSILLIGLICYYYGFNITSSTKESVLQLIKGFSIFYIFKYLFSLVYSLKWKFFFKDTRTEAILLTLFLFQFVFIFFCKYVLNYQPNELGIRNYTLFLHFFIIFIAIFDLSKIISYFTRFNISPPGMLLLSFFSLIIVGTALLSMPLMTTHPIHFVDALFTSTSSCCVTGLGVLDVSKDFTFRGQVVIMILMQLGGLSILSFASFFALFFARSQKTVRHQYFVKDLLSANKTSETSAILRQIILATLIIEVTGIGLLFIHWQSNHFCSSTGQTLFYAAFHAISAYNNCGYTLWSDNFFNPIISHDIFPQIIVMILILFGGLGFFVMADLFSPSAIRERRKKKWKKLRPSTIIVLRTTLVILVVGSLSFYFLEYHQSLSHKSNFIEKLVASIFQIVTGRTAGFNIVNMSLVTTPTLIITMLVMFIGASPGSTAGGIKTTTAFVIYKSVIATIRGKQHIEFRKRTIPFELVDKSFSIMFMSALVIFISVFAISIFEPTVQFINILFESVSAFATCGLSTGCTSSFSDPTKIILIIEMFIGRVGTLTFAFALSKRVKDTNHIYPSTYFMVG